MNAVTTVTNPRPLSIGLVIDRLDPARGGVEQWSWQFIQRLLAAGHQVHVLARGFAPHTRLPGVTHHVISAGKSRCQFAEAVARQARELRLDVWHDTGCGWHFDLFQPHGGSRQASFEQNLLLLPRAARPIKRAISGWLPRYREFEQLTRRQYENPDGLFLALSRMVADDLQRFHQVPTERIRLVYNGVDTERFSPQLQGVYRERVRKQLGLYADDTLLLIVAHNFKLKGVPTLLSAVGQLRQAGHAVHLAIAGGRPSSGWLRAAERRGAAEAVSFLGSVADPRPLYAAADVYVQPTFYDPCSLVVLEALASGLPCITSRFNGAGELMTPGSEGEIIQDPANAEELAEAIEPLVDPVFRAPMAQAARKLALEHTFQHNCDQLLNVYAELASRQQSRRLAA